MVAWSVALGGRGKRTVVTDQQMTNPEKDPDDWVTGDEPMTGPQRSYLHTLAREAGEYPPADLTKAAASAEIDRLQEKTGRGR
jgi:hypothetical protein